MTGVGERNPRPRVGVSMVLWRSESWLWQAAIEALMHQSLLPAAIAVHVNDGDSEVENAVRSTLDGLPVPSRASASIENLGFAGAHDDLLERLFEDRQLSLDAILVTNPDVVAAPDMLQALAAFNPPFGGPVLIGPVLELADPSTLQGEGKLDTCGTSWDRWARHHDEGQGQPLLLAPIRPCPTAGISGACIYVTRSAYERVVITTGEFFDRDFIAYREDAELGVRAGLVGVPSWIVPTATARHVRQLRGTERGKSVWIDYLSVRNRFLMRFKLGRHRPGRRFARNLRDVVVIVGVLTRERSSMAGLRDAWRLRGKMRSKRALLTGDRS